MCPPSRRATYAEALVAFRDLLDSDPDWSSEYVRGGVNLIADLFGVIEMDTGTRMERVEEDLRRLPLFADPHAVAKYGIAEYVRDGCENCGGPAGYPGKHAVGCPLREEDESPYDATREYDEQAAADRDYDPRTTDPDPLVLTLAGLMLEGARTADELHRAVEAAVTLIEAHPTAATSDDLRAHIPIQEHQLWLTDWDHGNCGGHTLVESESAARQLGAEWVAAGARNVTIAPVRLCEEEDPQLERYDFDHESYFALTGDRITIEPER